MDNEIRQQQLNDPAIKWFFSLPIEVRRTFYTGLLIDFNYIKELYAKHN